MTQSAAPGASPDAPHQDESSPSSFDVKLWRAVVVGLGVVLVLSLFKLRDFPYQLQWIEAWKAACSLMPVTGWAALKVWTCWGVSSLVVAGIVLRIDRTIDICDALIGGA